MLNADRMRKREISEEQRKTKNSIMADLTKGRSFNNRLEVKKRDKQISTEHSFKKRQPPQLPRRKIDIYVSTKTPLKAIFSTCEQLLEKQPEIVIHGLGAAVGSAIKLSLQLQRRFIETLQISVNTSSVELIDDLQPLTDKVESETRSRLNSAVHIQLKHTKKPV